jgi:hypothetical protein
MTIAISLKVNDGVVLATDSASTIVARPINERPIGVINVYQNAEKLFNLCKGKPIGVITWGSGSIGLASISTLMKDFRKRQMSSLQEENLSIEKIAFDLSNFIFEEKYNIAFSDWTEKPKIGFIVAGYSHEKSFPEEWKFEIDDGKLIKPEKIREENEIGIIWNGEPEAISRLILGTSPRIYKILQENISDKKIYDGIFRTMQEELVAPIIIAPMPIKDAIDVAEFLVDTTINFSKFIPGAPSVGGPIDIAAITKHEGFKWIKRKHYYNNDINPFIIGD